MAVAGAVDSAAARPSASLPTAGAPRLFGVAANWGAATFGSLRCPTGKPQQQVRHRCPLGNVASRRSIRPSASNCFCTRMTVRREHPHMRANVVWLAKHNLSRLVAHATIALNTRFTPVDIRPGGIYFPADRS